MTRLRFVADRERRPTPIDVLYVEDDSGVANSVMRLLRGFEDVRVVHVDTMSDAKKALIRGAFDVVLLDLGLPDAAGMTSVNEVRSVSDKPIVVFTGQDNPLMARRALESREVQGWLEKGETNERIYRELRSAYASAAIARIKSAAASPT